MRWLHIHALALLLALPACADADEASACLDGKTSSVVQIAIRATETRSSTCTATKVGRRHFLTARHCVEVSDAPRLELGLAGDRPSVRMTGGAGSELDVDLSVERTLRFGIGGEWCDLFECNTDSPADIALIVAKVDTPAVPEAVVDTARLSRGESLFVIGFGCKDAGTCAFPGTKLTRERRLLWTLDDSNAESEDIFLTSPSAYLGDSGGPVMRCGDGPLVVGVTSQGDGAEDGTTTHERLIDRPGTPVAKRLRDAGARVR